MCFCPSSDLAGCALLPVQWHCSVLLSTKDAEQRFRVKVLMQRVICEGRFPLWAVRDACLQGFSLVGPLKEAVRQIWVVSEQRHYGGTEQTSWCDGDYFKADHRDGLAAQFLFCSLWCAPPTCFLCSLCNSGLYIQTFHTYSRLTQSILLLLNMVKAPLILSFLKSFHYTDHSYWLLQYCLLPKASFWDI